MFAAGTVCYVETKRRGLDRRHGFAVGFGGGELSMREIAISKMKELDLDEPEGGG
ncbi:hypothetical protein BofuT4_uP162520.1 [Botrytis cinerea T4]|uniref:Uncharacterized protein n=1 Tax=Botryotinia fuckeliana (strain T4) TaxID=999810 RepID=G2YT59_BOTF4|nr:hypothetical protein BofuT4_uP162520.1 [Botrytis cinerea T4]